GGLDQVAVRAADAEDLGAEMDRNAPRSRLEPRLSGSESGEPGERVAHAVDGELGPALPPEVRGHLRRRHGAEHTRQLLRTRRVAAVKLADVEADHSRVGTDRVTVPVYPGADRDVAAERALAADDRGHPLVVDPILEIDDDAVARLEILRGQLRGPVGVIALDGDEHGVERRVHGLQLV